MFTFSNVAIVVATKFDLPKIESLLNAAYRGKQSTKGWTTEAHLIAGNVRTNLQDITAIYNNNNSVFVLYKNKDNIIEGCVNLQVKNNKIYLGMFAVNPLLQGAGIGKQLLKAAEEYTLYKKYNCIFMTVISVRFELIAWYIRNGYVSTGITIPFAEDGLSGKHLQTLEFVVLEKHLY